MVESSCISAAEMPCRPKTEAMLELKKETLPLNDEHAWGIQNLPDTQTGPYWRQYWLSPGLQTKKFCLAMLLIEGLEPPRVRLLLREHFRRFWAVLRRPVRSHRVSMAFSLHELTSNTGASVFPLMLSPVWDSSALDYLVRAFVHILSSASRSYWSGPRAERGRRVKFYERRVHCTMPAGRGSTFHRYVSDALSNVRHMCSTFSAWLPQAGDLQNVDCRLVAEVAHVRLRFACTDNDRFCRRNSAHV